MKKLFIAIIALLLFFVSATPTVYAQTQVCTGAVVTGSTDTWVWGTRYSCTADYPKMIWTGTAYEDDYGGCGTYDGWILETSYQYVCPNGTTGTSGVVTCCNTTSAGATICDGAVTGTCGSAAPPTGGGTGGDDTGGGDDTAGPYCGDLACNGTETCTTCVSDCGACTITGNVNARAVLVPSDATSCADVNSSTTYIPASFSLTPPGTTRNNAGDGSYSSWTNVPMGASGSVFYLVPSASSQYVQRLACWNRDNPAGSGTGTAASLTVDGSTLIWTVGYSLGTPWFQAEGGDVYASAILRSYVQPGASTPVVVRDGTGGYPGVVAYGTSYDFDSALTGQGNTNVSSTNWLAYAPRTTVDYYDYFYRRFGSPATPYAFADLLAVDKPTSSETPYYVVGDMTTAGDWVVGDGESVVFIVDGNVTIGGSITTTGTGFVAFIVNGDIAVDSAVGTAYNSQTPVLQGIYITSPTGTFDTGTSTAASSARFVGEGMFIAGDFLLQRDLEGYGTGNTTHAAELFIYDPQLLFTMPDPMKELPVTWQEVAP